MVFAKTKRENQHWHQYSISHLSNICCLMASVRSFSSVFPPRFLFCASVLKVVFHRVHYHEFYLSLTIRNWYKLHASMRPVRIWLHNLNLLLFSFYEPFFDLLLSSSAAVAFSIFVHKHFHFPDSSHTISSIIPELYKWKTITSIIVLLFFSIE